MDGALCDGINHGRVDIARLRNLVAAPRLLDAVRLQSGADVVVVTTLQIREVVELLIAAGQWQTGGAGILAMLDVGYDASRSPSTVASTPCRRCPQATGISRTRGG